MKKRLILMINLVILILVFSSLVLASPPVIRKSEIKFDISPENSYFFSEKSFVRAIKEENNLNNVFHHINNHILLSVNKAKSFNEAKCYR
ncbi:MAG: hypothetical protein K9K76_07605 [Halanaerobiales bacterium]|nr:hypothetical protein [Halanaerobiales bacterium]